MRNRLLLIVALAASGCMPAKVTRAPYEAVLTAAGRAASPVGTRLVTIRTYEDVGINRTWLEDAMDVPCTVSGAQYSAKILTPAEVRVPIFAGTPQRFEVVCSHKGQASRRSNDCYYGGGEPGSFTDPAGGACLRNDVSVIFDG